MRKVCCLFSLNLQVYFFFTFFFFSNPCYLFYTYLYLSIVMYFVREKIEEKGMQILIMRLCFPSTVTSEAICDGTLYDCPMPASQIETVSKHTYPSYLASPSNQSYDIYPIIPRNANHILAPLSHPRLNSQTFQPNAPYPPPKPRLESPTESSTRSHTLSYYVP